MRQFAVLLAITIVLLGAGWTQASLTTVQVVAGDYVVMSPGSRQYVQNNETGGEFQITVYANATDSTPLGSFFTFCADPSTFMNYNTRYKVNAVADANHLGYDLSDYGKWIYYEYAKNDNNDNGGTTLASFIPGHTITTSNPNGVPVAGGDTFTSEVAGAIQEGIWKQLTYGNSTGWQLSGWTDDSAYTAVSGREAWATHFAAADHDDSSFAQYKDAIGIAQLTLGQGDVQNQMVLTMVANPGPTVPEPATIVVWLLLGAASGLGMRIRRRASVGCRIW
jgi:hypothetical protein